MVAAGEQVHLVRVHCPRAQPGRLLLGRALAYVGTYAAALAAAFRGPRPGRIIVSTTPPFSFAPLVLRAALSGAELVLVHHDIFPENAELLGLLRTRLLTGPLRWLRNRLIRRAAVHRTLSEEMAATLRPLLGPEAHIDVNPIPPPATGPILPDPRSPWRVRHGLADRFVVMYAGNLGAMYDFTPVLEAAEELRAEEELAFVFVGSGYHERALQEAAARSDGRIVCLPPAPEQDLPELLAAANAHVIPLIRGGTAVMWPSKVEAIQALPRPILTQGWHLPTAPPQAPNLATAIQALRHKAKGDARA